ncbi:hypothetical protein vseg_019733 [Gypsophila vaccaria]
MPKHAFVRWLGVQNRLLTRDMLVRMGIFSERLCCICGLVEESVKHLFFQCTYIKHCLELVATWLGVHIRYSGVWQELRRTRRIIMFQRQILFAYYNALCYHIWWVRNKSKVELMGVMPGCVVK